MTQWLPHMNKIFTDTSVSGGGPMYCDSTMEHLGEAYEALLTNAGVCITFEWATNPKQNRYRIRCAKGTPGTWISSTATIEDLVPYMPSTLDVRQIANIVHAYNPRSKVVREKYVN